MNLEKIKRSRHKSVIANYWQMLQECEQKAIDTNDPVLKHQVEGWYREWNRMTDDNKVPRWQENSDAT